MRVALVHDYFTQLGGAERVVAILHRLLAPDVVAAAVVDRRLLPAGLDRVPVRHSALQPLLTAGLPLASLAPLLPMAFARLPIGEPDVVVSSSSAFAHHVGLPRGARHVAYIHTPARFVWQTDEYFREQPWQAQALRPVLGWFRRRDRAAVDRADVVLANSAHTAARLATIHGRDARVVHPPVDVDAFQPSGERSGRFLVVARLRPYKRIEAAIGAAERLGVGLDVVGSGPDLGRLRRLAGPGTRFLGRLPDSDVARLMATCEGLVVPGIEDFGLTMAEVQAAGRPPIAVGAGGACEIIDDGRTGFLAAGGGIDELAAAMERARTTPLQATALRGSAERFGIARFGAAMRAALGELGGA